MLKETIHIIRRYLFIFNVIIVEYGKVILDNYKALV